STVSARSKSTLVLPRGTHVLRLHIPPPAHARKDSEVRATFEAPGERLETTAILHPLPRTKVPRLKQAPALDGTNRGWEDLELLTISPNDAFQGKPAGQNDCSARFRLAHDGKTLFVDVQVSDDAIISNIAPNDIKGHWRSDSVEICIDPAAGAEDTVGC